MNDMQVMDTIQSEKEYWKNASGDDIRDMYGYTKSVPDFRVGAVEALICLETEMTGRMIKLNTVGK